MNTNFTTKLLGSAFFLLTATLTAEAAHLTPQQSLSRAESSSSVRRLPGNAQFTLAHTEKAGGESFLYVFNKGDNGFIVTSADDRMPAVLGYSENGAFDPSNESPEFKWWISQYAAQAEAGLKTDRMVLSSAPAKAPKANVDELLTTRWDQDSPYNLDCPSDGGERCVTGCVATAMAQVIKYHGYPANGNGTASYVWNGNTLSYDYSNANFDYQNMLDEYPRYDDTYTQEQQQAVANLLYACGVGVNMNYGTDASGASDIYIPYALKEYFNYDKDIQFLQRDYFTASDWDDIVYAELAAGRPVIYGGQSNNGGHEFVCDGYDDGYFHINWGWSGYCNGWFLLSALDPEGQGIGGGDGGYNYQQSIIIGVQPNAGNPGISYPLYATGGLEALSVNSYLGQNMVLMGVVNGGVMNYSIEEISTSFFLKVVSSTGEEYVADSGCELTFPAGSNEGLVYYPQFYCSLPSVPEGEYKAYVQYMGPQGELMPLRVILTGANYVDLTVDADGNVSFSAGAPEEKASIVVTEFAPASTIVSGEEAQLNLTIQNTGNVTYSGVIFMNTYPKGENEPVDSQGIEFILGAGQSVSGHISYVYELPDGEYDVRFYDMYDEPCSDVFTLTIGTQEVEVTSISLDASEKTLTEGESFTLTATVDPENASDKTITWSSSNPEVASVEDGKVEAIAPGTAIITAATSNGLTATCTVTVDAKEIAVAGISLDITEKTLTEGDSFTLTATVEPADASDKTVTWTSSDASVATVADGVVTAVAPGAAVITATTANGLNASCTVTVEKKFIYATSISLNKTSIEAEVGETVALVATVLPDDATEKTVAWSSTDESVATVDQNGNVTIISTGIASIIAATTDGSDLQAECSISGVSYVETLVIEAGNVDIYTLDGVLLRKNADASYVSNLAKGTYIIRTSTQTLKIVK